MDNQIYITVQGDTWDKIAYEKLGSEYLLPLLLEANYKHRGVVIFSGGIPIVIPSLDESDFTERPEWMGEVEEL